MSLNLKFTIIVFVVISIHRGKIRIVIILLNG